MNDFISDFQGVFYDDGDVLTTKRRGRHQRNEAILPHSFPSRNADYRTEDGSYGPICVSSFLRTVSRVENLQQETSTCCTEGGGRDIRLSRSPAQNQFHRDDLASFGMTETRLFNGWSHPAAYGTECATMRQSLLHTSVRLGEPSLFHRSQHRSSAAGFERITRDGLPDRLSLSQAQGSAPAVFWLERQLQGRVPQQEPPRYEPHSYEYSRSEAREPPANELARYEPPRYGSSVHRSLRHEPSHRAWSHEGVSHYESNRRELPLDEVRPLASLTPDQSAYRQRSLPPCSVRDILVRRATETENLLGWINSQRGVDWPREASRDRDGSWREDYAHADAHRFHHDRAVVSSVQQHGELDFRHRHRAFPGPVSYPRPFVEDMTDCQPASSAPRPDSRSLTSPSRCDPATGLLSSRSVREASEVSSGQQEQRFSPLIRSLVSSPHETVGNTNTGGSKAMVSLGDPCAKLQDSAASWSRAGLWEKTPEPRAGKRSSADGCGATVWLCPPRTLEQGTTDKPCSSAAALSSTPLDTESVVTAASSVPAKTNSAETSSSSVPRSTCSDSILRRLLYSSANRNNRGERSTDRPPVGRVLTVGGLVGDIVDTHSRTHVQSPAVESREPRAEQVLATDSDAVQAGVPREQGCPWLGNPTLYVQHNPLPPPEQSDMIVNKEVPLDSSQRGVETNAFPRFENDTDAMKMTYAIMCGQGTNSPERQQASGSPKVAESDASMGISRTQTVHLKPVVSSDSFACRGPADVDLCNVNPSDARATATDGDSPLRGDDQGACFIANNSQESDVGLGGLGDICHTCLACNERFASSGLLEDHLLEHMQFQMDDCRAEEDEEGSFARYDENMGREHPSHLKLEYLEEDEVLGTSDPSDNAQKCCTSEVSGHNSHDLNVTTQPHFQVQRINSSVVSQGDPHVSSCSASDVADSCQQKQNPNSSETSCTKSSTSKSSQPTVPKQASSASEVSHSELDKQSSSCSNAHPNPFKEKYGSSDTSHSERHVQKSVSSGTDPSSQNENSSASENSHPTACTQNTCTLHTSDCELWKQISSPPKSCSNLLEKSSTSTNSHYIVVYDSLKTSPDCHMQNSKSSRPDLENAKSSTSVSSHPSAHTQISCSSKTPCLNACKRKSSTSTNLDPHKQSFGPPKAPDPELDKVNSKAVHPNSSKQESSTPRGAYSDLHTKSSRSKTSDSDHHKQRSSHTHSTYSDPHRQQNTSSKIALSHSAKQASGNLESSQSCPNKQTSSLSKPTLSCPNKQTSRHSKPTQSCPNKQTSSHSKSTQSCPNKQTSIHLKPMQSCPNKQTPSRSKHTQSCPKKETSSHLNPPQSCPNQQTSSHSKPSQSCPNQQTSSHSKPSQSCPNKQISSQSKMSLCGRTSLKINNTKASQSRPTKRVSDKDGAEGAKSWKILSSGQVFKMKSTAARSRCMFPRQCATEEQRKADFGESSSPKLPNCPQSSQHPESQCQGKSGSSNSLTLPDCPQSSQRPESRGRSGGVKKSGTLESVSAAAKSRELSGFKRSHSGPKVHEDHETCPAKVRKLAGPAFCEYEGVGVERGKKRHASAEVTVHAKKHCSIGSEFTTNLNRLRSLRELCRPLSIVLERCSAENVKLPATQVQDCPTRQPSDGERGQLTVQSSVSESPAKTGQELGQSSSRCKHSAGPQGSHLLGSKESSFGPRTESSGVEARSSSENSSSELEDSDAGFFFCKQCYAVFTKKHVFRAHPCFRKRHEEEPEADEGGEEPETDRDGKLIEGNEETIDDNHNDQLHHDSGLSDDDNSRSCPQIDTKASHRSRSCRKQKRSKETAKDGRKIAVPPAQKKGGRKKGRRKSGRLSSRDNHMLRCDRCDRNFSSRGGLLFHWQHVHTKLVDKPRI